MDRHEVADVLEEIAGLLDAKGESPFKSRAYRNAALTLRTLGRDLAEMARAGSLRELPGIGEALADKIGTLALTGSLPYYERLRAEVPEAGALQELLRVPGLGAKKARLLIDALQVRTLGELERACRENRLIHLPGFGGKAQDRILAGLGRLLDYRGRWRLAAALATAEALRAEAAALPGIEDAVIAGAARRGCETVGEIALVVVARDRSRAAAAVAGLPRLRDAAVAPGDEVRARADGGIPVRLAAAAPATAGAALVWHTGSAAHLAALGARAAERGLALDAQGLRRGDARLPCPDEPGLYRALGLEPIPAELREDQGEIAAAESGALPDLVCERDVRGILHVHSTWSDGRLAVEDIVERCAGLGYEYVGISDHSQSARYARGLTPESVRQQQMQIAAAQAKHPGIRVLKGAEVDILPDGALDYPEEILARFDFVIASVHSGFSLPEAEQTRRLVRALQHPRTTILGHPTGRLLLAREPYAVDLDAVLRAAAAAGAYVELNAHPHRLDLDSAGCRRARALGVRLAIDPDAHDRAGLTDVRYGVMVARRAGLGAADILNTVPAARLDAALARGR